ncbi:MAG TPA: hypothetical protein VFI27_08475 [candidate division Zixibacteria bacterium]|nr:hypothetical protein [candidate division Zixibacteria bacterium]
MSSFIMGLKAFSLVVSTIFGSAPPADGVVQDQVVASDVGRAGQADR